MRTLSFLLGLSLLAAGCLGADELSYDNGDSGLDATDVQTAVDELNDRIVDLDVSALELRVDSLEAADAAFDTAVAALDADQDAFLERLDDHAMILTAHRADIDANTADMAENAADITQLGLDLAALQSQVDGQVTVRTRLNYSSGQLLPGPMLGHTHYRDVGDFVKTSESTDIQLTWNSHFTLTGTNWQFCDFQLRIDGSADATNGGRAVNYGTSLVAAETVFTGLASGPHTVSIWYRTNATSCEENDGNFQRTVWVEEAMAQ